MQKEEYVFMDEMKFTQTVGEMITLTSAGSFGDSLYRCLTQAEAALQQYF